MVEKLRKDNSTMLLIFLALFSLSIGVFYNYNELWLDANGLTPASISRILSICSIVTVLSLLFFSLKFSMKQLKNAMTKILVLNMITSTILLCLNGSGFDFGIKFFMFFDAALKEIIVSNIYLLMISARKDDVLYTKKESIEYFANKIGFFLVAFFLGKKLGSFVFDYNTCLLLSVLFSFLSFLVLIFIKIENKDSRKVTLTETFKYFNKNRIFYLYLLVHFIGSAAWASLAGLKMLTLTETLSYSAKTASYIVLIMGILTSVLAMIIVKYLKAKNDHINCFFKYGFRVILYLLIFLTNDKTFLFIALIYLLLTDNTYSFLFSGHFINHIDANYAMIYNVIKYCVGQIGNGLGVFICGLTFNLEIKYIGLVTLVLGLITYVFATVLVSQKSKVKLVAVK